EGREVLAVPFQGGGRTILTRPRNLDVRVMFAINQEGWRRLGRVLRGFRLGLLDRLLAPPLTDKNRQQGAPSRNQSRRGNEKRSGNRRFHGLSSVLLPEEREV